MVKMNAHKQESVPGTLAFAAIVAFCCALIVSLAVWWLRPIQLSLVASDETRAILETAGLVTAGEVLTDREIGTRFLQFEVLVVDIKTYRFFNSNDPADYNYRVQLNAGQNTKLRYMPLYLLREKGRITGLVVPLIADGMWSTIYGFVALGGDFSTVVSVNFYDHGETPGIGDKIQAAEWQWQWVGKQLFDENGSYRFQIRSNPDPLLASFSVDAITGATVTVSAVNQAMSRWFGDDGYGPALKALREEQR
jgi:Na+-transporting NADH:ubiquinone oxidoreductase subunit C